MFAAGASNLLASQEKGCTHEFESCTASLCQNSLVPVFASKNIWRDLFKKKLVTCKKIYNREAMWKRGQAGRVQEDPCPVAAVSCVGSQVGTSCVVRRVVFQHHGQRHTFTLRRTPSKGDPKLFGSGFCDLTVKLLSLPFFASLCNSAPWLVLPRRL